jgi:hypothetical protein
MSDSIVIFASGMDWDPEGAYRFLAKILIYITSVVICPAGKKWFCIVYELPEKNN